MKKAAYFIIILLTACMDETNIPSNYVPADYIVNHGESLEMDFYTGTNTVSIDDTDLSYTSLDGNYSITLAPKYVSARCVYDHTTRYFEYNNREELATVQTLLNSDLFLIDGYYFNVPPGKFNPIKEYRGSQTPVYSLHSVSGDVPSDLTINSSTGEITIPNRLSIHKLVISSQEGISCHFVINVQ